MAETPPAPARPRPVERTDYKPLSILALASLAVSGLYVAATAALTVSGLVSGQPVLIPALLLIAAVGVALSVAARLQIRKADGALAGLALSGAAWWLGVVGGSAYAAYLLGNRVYVQSQSDEFALEWFESLRERRFGEAFAMTLPPESRRGQDPDSEGFKARYGGPTGQLSRFLSSELVRLFVRARPADVSVEHVGLKAYDKTPEGYLAVQTYRVTTPEGAAEVVLRVLGVQAEGFGERQWQVIPAGKPVTDFRPTDYGLMISQLGSAGVRLAGAAVQATQVDPRAAYLLTVPEDRRGRLVAASAGMAVAGGPGSVMPSPDLERGYREFLAGDFFRKPGSSAPEKELAALWESGRLQPAALALGPMSEINPGVSAAEDWSEARVEVPVGLALTDGTVALGTLTAVTREPSVLGPLREAYEAAKADPSAGPGDAPPLRIDVNRWHFESLTSDMVGTRPEQPRMPGMPPG